jgi:Protein of unknown function (DUF3039)
MQTQRYPGFLDSTAFRETGRRCEGGRKDRCEPRVEADSEPCGWRFQPVRDPQRFPVCPKCKELAAMLWGSS